MIEKDCMRNYIPYKKYLAKKIEEELKEKLKLLGDN